MLSAIVRALVVAVLPLAVSAPAHAALIAASADPHGDAASPELGHDLIDVGFGYDRRTGRIGAAFQLRGRPDSGAFVSLVAGTRDPAGTCGGPAVGVGTYTNQFDGMWHRFANPQTILAQGELDKRGIHSSIQRLEVDDKRAAGVRPNCLIAELGDPDTKVVYDRVGPVALVAHPDLAVKLDGVPEDVKAGRSHRLRITVSNPGDAPTKAGEVLLSKLKGVTYAKRRHKLKPIAAGAKRTIRVRVRFSRAANFRSELAARVEAGDLRVEQNLKVYVAKPRSRKRGRKDGSRQSGTCVRFIPDLTGESGGSLGLVPCER